MNVAVAARPWEKFGPPVRVTWFPKSEHPVVLASPAPGSRLDPLSPIRLTYSQSVSLADHPLLSLRQQGKWAQTDSHTLVFRPTGDGAPFDSDETIRFAKPVDVLGGTTWHVAGASFLRLQQLLAQEGYLPLDWAAGKRRRRAHEARRGRRGDGSAGRDLQLAVPEHAARARGAVAPGRAGHGHARRGDDVPARPPPDRRRRSPARSSGTPLIADAIAGKRQDGGYSYVYVHRNVPQS